MTDSRIDIANQALARLGEDPISAFDEDTFAAAKVALLYEPTILSLLSAKDWFWARVRATLAEDAAADTPSGWDRGFLLPSLRTDRVGPPLSVYSSAMTGAPASFAYEIKGKWLFTNATTCVIEYTQRKNEAYWPGYFVALAAEAVAATLALPITENASKEEFHRAVAFGSPSDAGRGGLFHVAEAADDSGDPSRGLLDDDDPIWAARFGGVF